MKFHQLITDEYLQICYRNLSCFCTRPTICTCYNLKRWKFPDQYLLPLSQNSNCETLNTEHQSSPFAVDTETDHPLAVLRVTGPEQLSAVVRATGPEQLSAVLRAIDTCDNFRAESGDEKSSSAEKIENNVVSVSLFYGRKKM